MIALRPAPVNAIGSHTPIDQRTLPAIDGSGLTMPEWFRINGVRNKAMSLYAADCPEATPGEIDAVGDRAAGDALRSVLRARAAAPPLPCCSPAEVEPCAGCSEPASAPVARRFKSEDEFNDFVDAVEADGDFHREMVDRQLLPFVSTCHDVHITVCPYKITLDEFIAAEVRDFSPEDGEHRAIWCGGELLAVIRPDANGKVEVIRLDTMVDMDAMVDDDPRSWPEWTEADRWELGPDPDDIPDFEPTADDSEWFLQEQAAGWNLPALSGGAPDEHEPSALDRWIDEAMPEPVPDLSDDFGGAFGGLYASEGH